MPQRNNNKWANNLAGTRHQAPSALGNLKPTYGSPQTSCAARWMQPISRPIFSRCCSSSASATSGTMSTQRSWRTPATPSWPCFQNRTVSRFLKLATGTTCALSPRMSAMRFSAPCARLKRPTRHPLWRLWRCAVDQQGSTVRCPAQGSGRAFLASATRQQKCQLRPAWRRLRIPDQEICRRHQQEGGRVLYPAQRGAPDDQDARPQRGGNTL